MITFQGKILSDNKHIGVTHYGMNIMYCYRRNRGHPTVLGKNHHVCIVDEANHHVSDWESNDYDKRHR